MSPRMAACPNCAEHVFSTSTTCPHCDGLIRGEGGRILKTAGAAMLGLVLTGCSGGDKDDTGDTGNAPQPDYGVADSGYYEPGDSGQQPEYGVPATKD
jgi:hypothetical protein